MNDIATILLEKGLLAMIVVLFSWFLTRSIEKLKASMVWNGELLRQRMDAAKRTLTAARAIQQSHLGLVGGRIVRGTGVDPQELLSSARELQDLRVELRLLQAGAPVLDAISTTVTIALDALGEKAPAAPTESSDLAQGNLSIPAENLAWLEEQKGKMQQAIDSLEDRLSRGFKTIEHGSPA